MALFDLSSSWVTDRCNPLAARGYSRDRKKGLEQIEYEALTTPARVPVAVRVFACNTIDPAAFTAIAKEVRALTGLEELAMAGDRGMITAVQIEALK